MAFLIQTCLSEQGALYTLERFEFLASRPTDGLLVVLAAPWSNGRVLTGRIQIGPKMFQPFCHFKDIECYVLQKHDIQFEVGCVFCFSGLRGAGIRKGG